MKRSHVLLSLLAASLLTAGFCSAARAATITVQIIQEVNYPHAEATFLSSINDNNEVAGFGHFRQGTDVASYGFTYLNGHFSPILDDPDGNGLDTEPFGINNAGTLCGEYQGTDGQQHGFFYSDGTYTTYDVPGGTNTQITGLNNNDDFVCYIFTQAGYENIDGTLSQIVIPNGLYVQPNAINDSDQIVGSFAKSHTAGFYSTPDGTLHYPVNAPGASQTSLYGINNRGWMVGYYQVGPVQQHGLLFIPPRTFITVDYNGSQAVRLTGINNNGFACGWYLDSAGMAHGILGRIQRSPE